MDIDCVTHGLTEESWRRGIETEPCAEPLFLLGNKVDPVMVKLSLVKLVPAILFL